MQRFACKAADWTNALFVPTALNKSTGDESDRQTPLYIYIYVRVYVYIRIEYNRNGFSQFIVHMHNKQLQSCIAGSNVQK